MEVILETDRLRLRQYVEGDAEAFFELNSDPKVLRFVLDKPLLNVEQARQILIDHPIADYRKHAFGRGACILKTTGQQIGFAGLKFLEELDEVDVAYRLLPAYWGQGLATEAALASVRYGFDNLGLKKSSDWPCRRTSPRYGCWKKPDCVTPKRCPFWGIGFRNIRSVHEIGSSRVKIGLGWKAWQLLDFLLR